MVVHILVVRLLVSSTCIGIVWYYWNLRLTLHHKFFLTQGLLQNLSPETAVYEWSKLTFTFKVYDFGAHPSPMIFVGIKPGTDFELNSTVWLQSIAGNDRHYFYTNLCVQQGIQWPRRLHSPWEGMLQREKMSLKCFNQSQRNLSS